MSIKSKAIPLCHKETFTTRASSFFRIAESGKCIWNSAIIITIYMWKNLYAGSNDHTAMEIYALAGDGSVFSSLGHNIKREQFIVFSHVTGLKTRRAKHPQNCSTSVSIFHLFHSRKYVDHISKEKNKGISEQNASFGHLQSILSNISIINSATKRCKNT